MHQHERIADVMAATGWIVSLSTLALEFNPLIQFVSLLLACAASVFAIIFYWSRINGRE